MNYKEIQTIIKNFEKSNLTVLELTSESFNIKLSKLNESTVYTKKPNSEQQLDILETSSNHYELKSPLVGTFYAANSPKNAAFVKVGDVVKEKQPLCVIEAMKIMNEITSPISGTIKAINFKNGQAIGFDQILMVIE